jgi:hypothetical protein
MFDRLLIPIAVFSSLGATMAIGIILMAIFDMGW